MATDGSKRIDPAGEGELSRARPAGEQRSESAATSDDPKVLTAEIERTREDLAQTVDAIADKVSPKRVADRTKAQVGERVADAKTTLSGKAASAKVAVLEKTATAKGALEERTATAKSAVSERTGSGAEPTEGSVAISGTSSSPALHEVRTVPPTSSTMVPPAVAGAVGALVVALLLLRRRRR